MEAATQLWQQVTGNLPDEAAKGLIVRFELVAEMDEKASADEGRAVFSEYEYIEIRSPNDQLSVVHRRVEEKDKRTFPQAYRSWKEGSRDALTGTPLKEWAPIAKSQAELLAFKGIRTVEQFVEVSDDGCHQLGHGILTLRNKAQAWLLKANDASATTKMAVEMQAKDSEIRALKQQMADIVAKLAERDDAPQRNKPKREAAQ
jgi:hypothetical protein